MKDIDIHKGLPEQITRDFLSQSMLDAQVRQFNNKKVVIPHDEENPFNWSRLDAVAQIDYLEEYIKCMDTREAIWVLIKNKGWEEHDVSDYISNSYSPELRMSFIGTEGEYKEFIRKMNHQILNR